MMYLLLLLYYYYHSEKVRFGILRSHLPLPFCGGIDTCRAGVMPAPGRGKRRGPASWHVGQLTAPTMAGPGGGGGPFRPSPQAGGGRWQPCVPAHFAWQPPPGGDDRIVARRQIGAGPQPAATDARSRPNRPR